jgi:hypothetical protein
VVNLLASERADLAGGDFGHSDGPFVRGREFDLVTAAAFIDVNDRSNISHGQPMLGMVSGQRPAIRLFDRVLWDRDAILLSRLTSAMPHGKMQRCK